MRVGDKFKVEFENSKFNAEIIEINNYETYGITLKLTEYRTETSEGTRYTRPDSIIDVEPLWFTDHPRRRVIPINQTELFA